MRRVGRTEGDVGEEGPVGADALAVGDHLQHPVHQVLGEVVAVRGATGRLDRVVVGDQFGMELVGFAVEKPVEAVEAAGERPLVEGTGRRTFLHRCEVPLADREGGVAAVAQHLGEGGGLVAHVPEHVREAGAEVGDRSHARPVLRAAGEQCCACRRTQRRDVEVRELQPASRERIDVRRVDVAAEAAELGEADVIEEHHHDVRGRTPRVRQVLEPRLRVGESTSDPSLEFLFAHGRTLHRWRCGRQRAPRPAAPSGGERPTFGAFSRGAFAALAADFVFAWRRSRWAAVH